ncbi:MAG: hypothetical protein AB7T49_12815 [Oligoflexales bacterium]
MHLRKILVILTACAAAISCKPRSTSSTKATCDTQYLNQLSGPGDYECLSREVEVAGTMQRVIKFVYDRRNPNAKKVYFFNTAQYEFHYDFSRANLGVNESNATFNKNYVGEGANRKFNLGSIVLYTDVKTDGSTSQKLLFELWDGDEMGTVYMEELYKKLKEGIALSNFPGFLYHPISDRQVAQAQASNILKSNMITTDQLYEGKEYIALNQGEAVGYLTYVNNSSDTTELPCTDMTNIVVFEKVPNDLGLVSGVVTATFQTPLSHVNVKSKNRGTANMSLKNASQVLEQYMGKPVRLKVYSNKYEIQELPADQAGNIIKSFWAQRRPHINGTPQAILGSPLANDFTHLGKYLNTFQRTRAGQTFPNRIPKLAEHKKLIQIFGAKATNLGVIETFFRSWNGIQQFNPIYPETLGIPFDFFEAFMNTKQTGLDLSQPARSASPQELVNEILDRAQLLDPNQEHSICQVKDDLKAIRDIISRGQVPPKMLALFKKYIVDDPTSPVNMAKTPRIRLRSSTNSEDLEGFTGAGLYNSEGISFYKKLPDRSFDKNQPKPWASIEKDIKKTVPFLYSSVWNDRAYEEREWFSINGQKHLAIKAGLAFHAAYPAMDFNGVPGEVANGVMVTKNIYAPNDERKAYINGQHYDLAITNPPTAEELQEVGEDPNQNYTTEEIVTINFPPDDNLWNWRKWSYGIQRRSSVKNGAPVLNDKPEVMNNPKQMEIRRLAFLGQYISDSFAEMIGKDPWKFAIDIEWKLVGPQRRILIKQARPFELGATPPPSMAQGMAQGMMDFGAPEKPYGSGPQPEFQKFKE